MSGSLNKVILVGNLGRDPELKQTTSGQPVARFSIATTETWKDKAGEKQSKTEWHNIVVWGKLAEVCEKYLKKGAQVLIEGRIQYREYQDQQGVKKNATDIRCDALQMLGKREDGGRRDGGSSGQNWEETHGAPPPAGGASAGSYDDDIPF